MFEVSYKAAAEEIRNNLYMDDLSTTADSVEQAKKLLSQVVDLLSLGGFRAHKFASNEADVL
jgi:hypothetical protein